MQNDLQVTTHHSNSTTSERDRKQGLEGSAMEGEVGRYICLANFELGAKEKMTVQAAERRRRRRKLNEGVRRAQERCRIAAGVSWSARSAAG